MIFLTRCDVRDTEARILNWMSIVRFFNGFPHILRNSVLSECSSIIRMIRFYLVSHFPLIHH